MSWWHQPSWIHHFEIIKYFQFYLTLGRPKKANSYPRRGTRGRGLMEPPIEFLPLMESHWSSQQDEVYFMGGGATGGLWRHKQWSPSWPSSWILPRVRNQAKNARNGNFLCLTCKRTLHHFIHNLYYYCWTQLRKHAFLLKNGLTTYYVWRQIS